MNETDAGLVSRKLFCAQTILANRAAQGHLYIPNGSALQRWGASMRKIAKTICLRIGERTLLVMASGTARPDNRKFRNHFGAKPRMLDAEEVLAATSHPVGGVCPFGLPALLAIYCDVSLQAFEEVVPAAGATNAAVRLAPERLANLTDAEWVDVCR